MRKLLCFVFITMFLSILVACQGSDDKTSSEEKEKPSTESSSGDEPVTFTVFDSDTNLTGRGYGYTNWS